MIFNTLKNQPTHISNIIELPNEFGKFRYKRNIPEKRQNEYNIFISKYGDFFEYLTDEFHHNYLKPPYQVEDIEYFLTSTWGFEITSYGFYSNNSFTNGSLSGYWYWQDSNTRNHCDIFVNASETPQRQRFTNVHEITHPVQDLDFSFMKLLKKSSEDIQINIAERIADKTAARFLAHPVRVNQYRNNGYSDEEIAQIFNVSEPVITYTECF